MIYIHESADATHDAFVMYQNVIAEATLTTNGDAPDGPIANVVGPQTSDYWKSSSAAAVITVTLGGAVNCDCLALIGHNAFKEGGTIRLMAVIDSTPVLVQSVTPVDNSDIVMIFEGVSATTWQIHFDGFTPIVRLAMLGERLIIPYGVSDGYVPVYRSLDVDLSTSITIKGQFIGSFSRRYGASTSIKLARQDWHWIENEFDEFIRHFNEGRTFLWASCPELLPRDVAYCWRTGGTISPAPDPGVRGSPISLGVQAYVSSA